MNKPADTPDNPAAESSRTRRWWFRISAAILIPALLLAFLELVLRIGGYGYSTTFFKPLQIEGKNYLVENDKFGWRYFPPQLARSPAPLRMLAQKPAGLCRIFLLGESAALGDPRPAYGPGRYLQTLLEQRYPDRQFEVVCVAMTAINSHAILDIARECARKQGDIWIVYMGNNEMVGPFGAASVFGSQAPSRVFVRFSLALQETRVGQLLRALGRKLRHRPQRSWAGMEMFTENIVPPGDSKRARVYRNFRSNLEGILAAGVDSGAKVLLSSVGVNLKDSPPFSSVARNGLSADETAECGRLIKTAIAAEAQTNYAVAVQNLAQAASLDPQRADLQYYLGTCLLAQTNLTAARQHLQRGCDLDALPFRADSTINDALRDAGQKYASRGVLFFDAASALGAATSAGVPGEESFYEHVHFNFDGSYRLARAWADQVATILNRGPAASAGATATNAWASQADCERWLGLTDWNRVSVLDDMLRRMRQPPLSTQANNTRRWEALRMRWIDLRLRFDQTNAVIARKLYIEALQHAPDDERLHENFGEFLEATGDLAQAAAEWERVRQLIPQHHIGFYETGHLLLRQGKLAEARRRLLEAVALRPDLSEGWLELGMIHALEGHPAEALPDYEKAQKLLPQDPRVHYHLGKAYSSMHRQQEAIAEFKTAVNLHPTYWEAHYALGEELAFAGSVKLAKAEFEQVVRLSPNFSMAHMNLGIALAQEGKLDEALKELQEARRLDPKNQQIQQSLAKVEALSQKPK